MRKIVNECVSYAVYIFSGALIGLGVGYTVFQFVTFLENF